MPNHVLQHDLIHNNGDIELDLTSSPYSGAVPECWIDVAFALNAATIADILAEPSGQDNFLFGLVDIYTDERFTFELDLFNDSGTIAVTTFEENATNPDGPIYHIPGGVVADQEYCARIHVLAGTPPTFEVAINGNSIGTIDSTGDSFTEVEFIDLQAIGISDAAGRVWMDNFTLGTTPGGSEIVADDFEEGFVDPTIWNSFISTDSTVVVDPGLAPCGGETPDFTINVFPPTVTITQGGSGSTTVNTVAEGGDTETISLSSSGAPAGVTIGFVPSSITAGGSATIDIAVDITVTPGTYPITVTGTGTSNTHSASFDLIVTAIAAAHGIHVDTKVTFG